MSSAYKMVQKQDLHELHELSSVLGIVAGAWVRDGCQAGGKMYHREVKYT